MTIWSSFLGSNFLNAPQRTIIIIQTHPSQGVQRKKTENAIFRQITALPEENVKQIE